MATWLALYYFLFYSLGVAALVYSSILFVLRRDPLIGRFAVCTLAMTVIVVASSLLNFAGRAAAGSGRNALIVVNLGTAVVFSFLVVDFAAAAFPSRAAKIAKRMVLIAAAVILPIFFAARILGEAGFSSIIVLAFKNAAIIAATLIVLYRRKEAIERPFGRFFRIIAVFTAFLMPFIVWEELLDKIFPFPIAAEGPLLLPAVYGVWAASFLTVSLRERSALRPMPAEPDETFLSRYDVSPREADVLRLLLQGKSYKNIMTELAISMPTVKSHVASLYRKTGAANRVELSFKAASERRNGPLQPPK